MAYQMICMSTDYDCWHDSEDVSVAMVMAHMKANAENARHFVGAVLNELSKEEHAEQVQGKHLAGTTKFGLSTAKEGWGKDAASKLKWLFPGEGYE
jgi:5'-methylthioadenosine phosphorylase